MDDVSNPFIEESIGLWEFDDYSNDSEIENFLTLLNCALSGVKSHEALWQCEISLDQDGPPGFQPISIQKRSCIIHLLSNFWSCLLLVTLNQLIQCSCSVCSDQTEDSSGGGENFEPSINAEIPRDGESE